VLIVIIIIIIIIINVFDIIYAFWGEGGHDNVVSPNPLMRCDYQDFRLRTQETTVTSYWAVGLLRIIYTLVPIIMSTVILNLLCLPA
jgi:ABC-type sugar transport system permease subunit